MNVETSFLLVQHIMQIKIYVYLNVYKSGFRHNGRLGWDHLVDKPEIPLDRYGECAPRNDPAKVNPSSPKSNYVEQNNEQKPAKVHSKREPVHRSNGCIWVSGAGSNDRISF